MISFALIGGILLNIGAYLTFRGKIYEAVIVYLFADLCWIIMAYQRDDFWGTISIIIGVVFGFLAFVKMRRGDMNKSLNKKDNN
ncbi:MAG: hypothetical protein A2513_08365 [Sulfurimonas sp. RIFOXYD12_FULL_33_39]|uniref:hypothetical protein n=1 Tax=unclassified Sulfurimonas TaxID=2623549 RepID=UPI0008CC5302|nr:MULTISPECIES: hypothetical protein [unclassified Sulfurimonas]OHE01360.1 MAG: hypothetical protein A3G74_04040 [Sulfurimonas sp. RIFCSPLOWO2_12_FULL_34_6]OHE10099.1 MAG: hypothetical protein A2513_08365 [Sulfurimonas sp. RIFOXYD12_FULL_33_39]OHE14680.1 MAG: hypothetical protein A2530_02115 [Sulfurimonas sp. RIFOXYD2_FULL_34_21]DAB28393.1 MAG TPA: hypothetical protein CFH78_02700 [Sulfurimonas sp. UBA10385]